ncbi:MAG: hypothetical protein ACK6DP_15005 [Gemmatimonas sp.]|jgi:hypothetical protein|uniref:hypothetical protein n=1 Tax=Gemmatimonas sp. TaxID=1962908 RepID=UPI00391F9591
MDPETMFCYVMSDLDACIRSTWHYHQLRIAGLMRLLAIDEQPLVIQVNRTHRLRLAFSHGFGLLNSAQATGALEHDGIAFAPAVLEPKRLSTSPAVVKSSDLQGWLSAGAISAGATVWSVREFVQQMAYVEGLTHAGHARTEAARDLLTARKSQIRLSNLGEPILDLLKQIGRVTHNGLTPLFQLAQRPRQEEGWRYPTFTYEEAAT